MQPRPERVAHPEAACLLDENQEGGLKRVVGFKVAGQYGAADAENHGSVPLDQDGERELGGFAAVGREPLEKLTIRQVAGDTDVEESLEVFEIGRVFGGIHGCGSREGVRWNGCERERSAIADPTNCLFDSPLGGPLAWIHVWGWSAIADPANCLVDSPLGVRWPGYM